MIIKTSQVRKLFNERKVQINDDAVKMVGEMGERDSRKRGAPGVEGIVPRLTAPLFYIALGNLMNTHKE